MYFNTLDFAIFLPIVFFLYWFVAKNKKEQNIVILISSYVFYGWWDWRFLSLILFSTIVDFFIGIKLSNESDNAQRKRFLYISIFLNLGLLGIFKYYNFFVENFEYVFSILGASIKGRCLKVILPVGISFYTFQTLSYTIDIYRKRIQPTTDFIAFASFVSFFPQLVAGPIEKASHLLPQIEKKRYFDYPMAVNGMRQILWGLFKKIVIADNCAEYANIIFNNSSTYSGSTLLLGALFFTFQIYGDFSGYSDIAIGTGKLLGIRLIQNFNYPYFSRDIAEFWRRWHISLTNWFKDYLYIPLGGSRGSTWLKIRNTFIIFIVSGFWHGANWTFIIWGILNASYFLPLLLTKRNRKHMHIVAENKSLPSIKEFSAMCFTFMLTVIAWIFFRAENLQHAISYISRLFSTSIFTFPVFPRMRGALTIIFLVLIFIIIEWMGRKNKFAIEKLGLKWKSIYRYAFYISLIICLFVFGGNKQQFIYFQF